VPLFTNYSPGVFGQNPHTLVLCAQLECGVVSKFGTTVVWGWEQRGQRNFRAFCCWKCSLDALPVEYLNNG
jgi:hypothetical protein